LELLRMLKRDREGFSTNLAKWMKASIAAIESTTQSSVQALPRRFGETDVRVPALPFSKHEQSISRFDGGSELDVLREESARGVLLSTEQEQLLVEADPELWRRPSLARRDAAGVEVAPDAPTVPRVSVYTKPLNEFAVSCCPSYRRLPAMRHGEESQIGDDLATTEPPTSRGVVPKDELGPPSFVGALEAVEWQRLFGEDVRRLGAEVLVHICGDSCHKYSGSKTTQICRHGFYYVVSLADWRRRRRGKALRNSIAIVKQCKFGMQGRLLPLQEHPFECQSNYAALAALRCNFDMQDLRRVLPVQHWLAGELPHLGDRPTWGYMNHYEWDGDEWVARRDESLGALPAEPMAWRVDTTPSTWRDVLLRCLSQDHLDVQSGDSMDDFSTLDPEGIAAFSDALNTGFYINSYRQLRL
jgi:hypothetical protein